MTNGNKFHIPRGIGMSKRLFVAMAIVLSVITILFVYFIDRFSHHKTTNKNQNKIAYIESDAQTADTINKLQSEKYRPSKGVSKNTGNHSSAAQEDQKNSASLSDAAFKTAGDSSLSVYHASQETSSSDDITTDSPSAEPAIPQGQINHYDAQNGQSQKIAFLQSSANKNDVINSQLQIPVSKYELMAGTIIPATLVTGINSDLPGTITAKVSRDIYDTATGNYLLIPQGTTILGAYDSQVTYGQSRVLIAWQRLIFPNGDSFDLSAMPGADLSGMAGLTDEVDHHYTRIFGSALLMSVFGAAGQLSQPQDSKQMSNAQIIYGAIGQELSQTSSRLIAKNMNIQPTIQIRSGANFNVLLTRDMVLPNRYHFS